MNRRDEKPIEDSSAVPSPDVGSVTNAQSVIAKEGPATVSTEAESMGGDTAQAVPNTAIDTESKRTDGYPSPVVDSAEIASSVVGAEKDTPDTPCTYYSKATSGGTGVDIIEADSSACGTGKIQLNTTSNDSNVTDGDPGVDSSEADSSAGDTKQIVSESTEKSNETVPQNIEGTNLLAWHCCKVYIFIQCQST